MSVSSVNPSKFARGGGVNANNNDVRVKALIKNLDNTPYSIGLAILRERLLTYTENDLRVMEKKPTTFDNPIISRGMYKDYFNRVIEELKFDYENGGEVGEFATGGGVGKRMMSNTRMANDDRVATFKIGDMWKPNFDYKGMLKVGSTATISMGIDTLRELAYSFQDVNYHTINADLFRAIDFLEMGEDNQAHKSLDKFNKNCSEELNSTNFKKGGGVSGNDYVVNVGNIGNIPCDSLLEARDVYNEYVEQSKSGMGRAGNEYVGLYMNGEPMFEYFGTLDNDNEYKRGGVSGKDNRAKQVIRTINGKKRKFPIGDAWRKEHKEENESEKYEVPYSSRKG